MSEPTYTKQQTRWCSHPELIPTQWNQERPASCEMIRLCDCGANQSCGVCGWGQGSMPCPCRPANYEHYKQSLASNLDSIRKRVNTALLIKHEKIGHGAFSSHVYTENEFKIFEAVLMDYALGRMTAKQVVTSYTMLGIPHLLIVEAIEEGNKTKDDLNA